MKKLLLALALTIGLASPSFAQQTPCAPRQQVIDHLENNFEESRQTIAIAANGFIVETFANLEKGNWTVIMTRHDMVSCMVASGTNFELTLESPKPGEPS